MFHHTKVAQQKPPKPRLRLHVRPASQVSPKLLLPGTKPRDMWAVERTSEDGVHAYDRTAWWPTSRLALDAAYYQFACEWPAPRG